MSNYWVLVAIYSSLIIIGSIWIFVRRRLFPIKTRDWEFVLIGTVPAFVLVNVAGIHLALLDMEIYPSCYMILFPGAMVIPLWGMSFVVRAFYALLQVHATRGKMQYLAAGQKSWANRRLFSSRSIHISIYLLYSLTWFVITCAVTFTTPPIPGNPDFLGFDSHVCTDPVKDLITAQSCVLVFSMLPLVFFMWNIKEPYYVRQELGVMLVLGGPLALVYLINLFRPDLFPPPPTYQQHWIPMTIIGFSSLFSLYYPLVISFYSRQTGAEARNSKLWPSSLTNGNKSRPASSSGDDLFIAKEEEELFLAVVRNPYMLQAFQQFTVESWCVENLQFWTEVDTFKRQWDVQEPGLREQAAKKIIDSFIRERSVLEINVDSNVRKEAFEKFEARDITVDMFNAAQYEVELQLRQDSFVKWRHTKEFQEAWDAAGLATGLNRLDTQQSRKLSNAMRMTMRKHGSEESGSTVLSASFIGNEAPISPVPSKRLSIQVPENIV